MQNSVIGTRVVLLHSQDSEYDDDSGENDINKKDNKEEDSREIIYTTGDYHCNEVDGYQSDSNNLSDSLKCILALE